jgi:ribosomal protein S18 acetylase RimI-like enzyme
MEPAFAALLDESLLAATREFGRWQVGAVCAEGDGLLMIAGSTAFPFGYANCVLRTDPGVAPAEVLERAAAFFAPRGRGFTVFVRGAFDPDLEAALQRAGIASLVDTPCMVVDAPLAPPTLAAGCALQAVTDEAGAVAAREINAEAYQSLGLPAEETRALYGLPRRLLAPHYVTTLGYRDRVPVSTAMIIFSPLLAGVYWVGTTSGARRTGLAEACTRQVTNAAFERGARAVTLQASPMGEPIYARLGYRTFDRLRWYVVPPRAS